MVDDARAQTWEREARSAIARWYGTQEPAGNLACVVLALLHEREDLLRFIERSQRSNSDCGAFW
jgi:hypothetical protein